MTTGCPHYRRRCVVLAECCNRWVGCRLCHDALLGHDHRIDRFAIEWMRCNDCQTEQPVCVTCRTSMAAYYCAVCHLFDDRGRAKQVFHCRQCGICRVGGRENYYHCVTCCGCYPHAIRTKHRCVAASMHHDCPVCLEATFDSLDAAHVLPCGHVLHSKCYDRYVKHGNTTCPTCRTNMLGGAGNNRKRDDGIYRR